MRTASPLHFLLVLLFAAASLPRSRSAGAPLVGGYRPIGDVNAPHIKEIGQYAVEEHNKQSGQHLTFQRVVSGRQQVVAGMNYDLNIDAKDGAAERQYEAVVYERAWENYRSLTSFKPVGSKAKGGGN